MKTEMTDYRIEEYRFYGNPKPYFKPYRTNSHGLFEEYRSLRGNYCESYDEALKVIKDNHIEKVKTYNVTLDEELK